MKLVRSFVEFEGTPEEFQSVAHIFAPINSEDQTDKEDEEEPMVSPTDAVREMLNRIPIGNGQRAVYKALANGRLEYGEFLSKSNRTGREMAGILGALGRRINGTKAIHDAGLPGDTDALFEWPKVAGKKYIELKPYAFEALKIEEVV